jgi:hypothetical protein
LGDDFFAAFFAGARFAICGRFAGFADFLADDFFAELFRAELFFAELFFAEPFFAADPRLFDLPRAFADLPADFARDFFLPRAAMLLLLGIGGDVSQERSKKRTRS